MDYRKAVILAVILLVGAFMFIWACQPKSETPQKSYAAMTNAEKAVYQRDLWVQIDEKKDSLRKAGLDFFSGLLKPKQYAKFNALLDALLTAEISSQERVEIIASNHFLIKYEELYIDMSADIASLVQYIKDNLTGGLGRVSVFILLRNVL